ncbi:mycothiol synthase [Mycetocola reblochoni]|uniref:Mycothiol synthase n=1 Tax=Mycetocola reblochoni REB411 TaxID=1255698 RepID=A0A1R4JQU5_9MICO|nr:mycothiol synthase [Mycetocola reblochoni]SJN34367.1 Acetyl-CoA:Cys-GlcN-Ins acetyltransferase, mycothiol synthase MshD [Mycetocola reblochoni REB411]
MRRLQLTTADPADPATAAALRTVLSRAEHVDGVAALNEQARLELARGSRTLVLLCAAGDQPGAPVVGAAVLGGGELDLVVDPEWRGQGYASAALPGLLGAVPLRTAWSHGDHPAAAAIAASRGLSAVRRLHRMELSPVPEVDATAPTPAPLRIRSFTTDDVDAWVALNAQIFRDHAEQGALTARDVADRMAEPWFDAEDLLLAEWDGRLCGYLWLKREPDSPDSAEVYVVGVAAELAGHGIARALFSVAFARLADADVRTVELYVDDDNPRAVELYSRLGFSIAATETQYSLVPATTPAEELVTRASTDGNPTARS